MVAVMAALYAAGVLVRRTVLQAQYALVDGDLPFTLESALSFRRVAQVYGAGRVPALDPDIQYPGGIIVPRTDTVGAEYVYARLARLFPEGMELAERVRWIELLWFCAGIPLLALWIWWGTGSFVGAAAGAAFYAVGLSSVIRSTGQEISHENFALPLLIAHLAFSTLAERRRAIGRGHGAALVSALLLAGALMTWDLVQFYVLLWMAWSAWRMLRRGLGTWEAEDRHWLLHVLVLAGAGVLNPYLHAHGFLFSTPMLVAWGVFAARWVRRRVGAGRLAWGWGTRPALGAVILAVVLLGWVVPNPYASSYSHFAGLLAAKLRFLNRKPADPSLLTFEQSIMWVPGLNSANMALTHELFPVLLPLTIFAAVVLLTQSDRRHNPRLLQLLFFYVASLLTFALFARFHVFLAVFSAGLLGTGWAWAMGRAPWVRAIAVALVLPGLGVEAAHVVRRPERWGRVSVYYKELEELVAWLDANVRPQPVLANFGVSAAILTYAGCPIVLHPKFEAAEIRDRVRSYGEALFKGTEETFRDWADRHGARYYVYGVGEFSDLAPSQSMRYFVDALEPREDSAAWLFEFAPDTGKYFRYAWGNRKYRVYRIVGLADEAKARSLSIEARGALETGDLDLAEEKALAAMMLFPDSAQAADVLKHVGALRDQGFRGPGHERP